VLWAATSMFAAPTSSLTAIGQAINAYNTRDFGTAVAYLRNRNVPELADYVTYYLASSQQMTSDYDGALAVLTSYRDHPVASSPLAGKISLLHARVLLDKKDPALATQALRILQLDYKILPQPDGDFALGLAAEAAGEKVQAAQNYEHVYYSAPNTDLAAQSWTAMERLRKDLAAEFPEPSPAQQIERCEKWLAARQYAKARTEYSALADSLTGPERYMARVGVGVADYMSGASAIALHYLENLRVASPEADARRLYYLVEAARKMVDDTAMTDAVKELEERYPQSPWRLKALIAAGNRYVSNNDRAHYTPLFHAAADAFPSDAATAAPHWRLAWDAYTDPKPERTALLREQVQRYPSDGHASSALYFLGRVAESEGHVGEARAYYEALTSHFPHYFYTTLAKDRKQADPIDEDASAWLAAIAWPKHRDFSATAPNTATQQRLDRTRLLVDAGQPDLAEAEARFGINTGNEQAQLLALDLARSQPSTFKALHLMKGLTTDYLSVPTDGASARFWQMLFPMPWKDDVIRDAQSHDLDPYDVAALIRQESEFNPNAKSRANAYGLMQLLPSTGRMLGKQQGVVVTRPTMLFEPALNIALGTRYLRAQLDTWAGDWYRTLAAYNAGPGRVRQWTNGTTLREPLEFVENIPFDETREYVQAVLRNADMYKELYSKAPPPEIPAPAPAAVKKPAPPVPNKATKKPAAQKKTAS
jgi:soluble lytic murein transglycosylase